MVLNAFKSLVRIKSKKFRISSGCALQVVDGSLGDTLAAVTAAEEQVALKTVEERLATIMVEEKVAAVMVD